MLQNPPPLSKALTVRVRSTSSRKTRLVLRATSSLFSPTPGSGWIRELGMNLDISCRTRTLCRCN